MYWAPLYHPLTALCRVPDNVVDTELTKGTISFMILALLSRKSMYGYEIASTIRRETNGVLQWKEGTLYPNLHKLERDGLLRSRWEGAPGTRRRKYYQITQGGLDSLPEKKRVWAKFCQSVNAVLERSHEGE